jgi:ppGpp synthetase/RelA/SpoT-type nucleotidyltranferase
MTAKMPIPGNVISEAVLRYGRERDRYLELAARVADISRRDIVEANAIRAQVTARAKSAKSFEGKLRRFAKRQDKDFPTVDVVFEQIGDFAGVRIATWRPEDEARVADEIQKRFCGPGGREVSADKKDRLNVNGDSFYRATHCQVFLPEDELVGAYEILKGASCEIQVCSMMVHLWNEIEHDIGYKPGGGALQPNEKGLLEALGHLTRSGDAIITRLLEANEVRLEEQTGDFDDVYDFVARLRKVFPDADLSLHAGQLFEEIQALGLTSMEKLKEAIGESNLNPGRAKQEIGQFNQILRNKGHEDFSPNEDSSDLVLVLLLEKFAQKIEENHQAGRGVGRPPRIASIAKRFRQYRADLRG